MWYLSCPMGAQAQTLATCDQCQDIALNDPTGSKTNEL